MRMTSWEAKGSENAFSAVGIAYLTIRIIEQKVRDLL